MENIAKSIFSINKINISFANNSSDGRVPPVTPIPTNTHTLCLHYMGDRLWLSERQACCSVEGFAATTPHGWRSLARCWKVQVSGTFFRHNIGSLGLGWSRMLGCNISFQDKPPISLSVQNWRKMDECACLGQGWNDGNLTSFDWILWGLGTFCSSGRQWF